MGILQARIPEWVAMPSSRGSSLSRDGTPVSCTAGRFLTTEPAGKPQGRAKGEQKRCLMYTLRQLPTFSTSFLHSFTSSCTDPSIHPSDLLHPYHVPGTCWVLGHRDLKAKTSQFLLEGIRAIGTPDFIPHPTDGGAAMPRKKVGSCRVLQSPDLPPAPHPLFMSFSLWTCGFISEILKHRAVSILILKLMDFILFFLVLRILLKKFFFRWWGFSPFDLWGALE